MEKHLERIFQETHAATLQRLKVLVLLLQLLSSRPSPMTDRSTTDDSMSIRRIILHNIVIEYLSILQSSLSLLSGRCTQ
ncbi:MAG TPA: hypothetical protein VIY53_04995 [Acidobacteriaceae bacterium]